MYFCLGCYGTLPPQCLQGPPNGDFYKKIWHYDSSRGRMAFRTKYPIFLFLFCYFFLANTISAQPSPESLPLGGFMLVQGARRSENFQLEKCWIVGQCSAGECWVVGHLRQHFCCRALRRVLFDPFHAEHIRVAVVALLVTDLVSISGNSATGMATWRHLSSSPVAVGRTTCHAGT